MSNLFTWRPHFFCYVARFWSWPEKARKSRRRRSNNNRHLNKRKNSWNRSCCRNISTGDSSTRCILIVLTLRVLQSPSFVAVSRSRTGLYMVIRRHGTARFEVPWCGRSTWHRRLISWVSVWQRPQGLKKIPWMRPCSYFVLGGLGLPSSGEIPMIQTMKDLKKKSCTWGTCRS